MGFVGFAGFVVFMVYRSLQGSAGPFSELRRRTSTVSTHVVLLSSPLDAAPRILAVCLGHVAGFL